ncbi:hypothetical protein NKR23_g745 [Pleurostoma richardsiae]|uniref:Fungal N-terminal domain-containing protein n=1 Tax=Pleurostoma richardsiae TaxID=41990 RepID=A0AA38S7V6_9PEZI|nr:hypothetical protein NKR23_g745 [Pleurostoma richardsiae]
MTDPVGIAGTVTGLVSLGLQVYGGVTEYLDAIEARKEDISAAARRAEILRVAIDGIRGASSKIGPKYDLTRSAVTAGIWSCKTELQSLSNLIAELRPSMPPINLQEKLKEGAKKLHYPFRRRDLLRLEERLDKVNGMLQTALQALGLDISSSIEASISRVVRTTKDTQSCVEDISRNLVHVSQRLEQAVYARLSYMELQLAQNHTALDRIVQAFKVRLASPIDVNYDGKTLLHLAAGLMDQHSSPDQIAVASGIMDGLLMCGVPVNHLDLHGNTALAYVDPSAMVSAETMLLKHNAEAWYGDLTLALKYLLYEALGSSRIVASAHGIGPLSFAIVQGNKLLVEQILNVRPSALLEEVDNTGYTPLHLAVMNPSILEILLQREDSAKIINKANTTGDLPIHYALYFVQTTESIHSADLLLRAGSFCPLWPYGMLEQPAILSSAAWRMLLSHLKRRRLRLKKLALETLSKEDIRRLKLDSLGIPDARADDVVATLLANNVKVPAELGGSELSLTYRSSSVYFYIRHPNIADLAFSLGFRDVDSYNFAGLSPLIHHAIRRFYRPYFDWLVAHGADLHGVPSPAVALDWPDVNLHATAAHWVAGAIANGVGVLVEDWSDGTRNVINEIMALDLADNCDCWCSEKGCTPFLIFWKTLWGRITPGRHETLVNFSYLLRRHFQARMSPSQHRSLVRFLTFERLGLRHTCCVFRKSHKDDLYPYSEPICSHRYMSKEEVEEIHDEDREMLKLLEDLLADFKRELCSGVSLTGFLERLWTPRMQDVLRTLEARRLASEEIEAAEKIGVVWDTARMSNSHSYGPDPPEPESDEEDDEDTVEYWMAKLDEILPPETSDRR